MSDPVQRLAPVVRLAPSKINLTLAVVGRRGDGFHDLHSVVVPLALADRLSVAPQPAGDDTLHVTGFDPGPKGDNLILRAIASTRAAARTSWPGAPAPPPALAARLEKRIPVAAGLGGGSSDAAAAIDAALEAWGASVGLEERVSLAAGIGSDVPLFMVAGPALVEGRGERVTPLHGVRRRAGEAVPGVLLVTPAVPVHTADVFAAWSAGAMAEPGTARRTSEHFASEFGSGLGVGQLIERAAVLASANDLAAAAAAVVPELVPFRRAVMRLLGRPVGLSGSGPTLWVLYPSLEGAQTAAALVSAALKDGRLSGPGKGAPFVTATTIARGREVADEAAVGKAVVPAGAESRRSER
jgi:4-diphosphocytidyl-2-C-methyl-D-erythritol kinase